MVNWKLLENWWIQEEARIVFQVQVAFADRGEIKLYRHLQGIYFTSQIVSKWKYFYIEFCVGQLRKYLNRKQSRLLTILQVIYYMAIEKRLP